MQFGFLITAYNQLVQTEENILLIRTRYPVLNSAPIIVVSTSEVGGFKYLEQYDNVHVIEYKNAPGSKKNNFITKSGKFKGNPNNIDQLWRFQYLSARILLSIQLGLVKANELGLDGIVHLHSDSYWKINYAGYIKTKLTELIEQEKVVLADFSRTLESEHELPKYFNWHPEGMMFNLHECRRTGYGLNFNQIYQTPNSTDKIVDKDQYYCKDFGCIEKILSTWLLWTLEKKNIFSYYDSVPDSYYNKLLLGIPRDPHGVHKHGLVNKAGTQETQNEFLLDPTKPRKRWYEFWKKSLF